ncbi:hypothetical protein HQ560_04005, partial [bacterium]|nr:hypothetical protein [bacterium]
LSWKFMVPFKDKNNAMPDNFGIAWYSPGVWMNFVGAVEFAWQQYEQLGDQRFLRDAYDELFRPLYWTGVQHCYGIELNAIDDLVKMATVLGRGADAAHWRSLRPARERAFPKMWEAAYPDYYAAKGTPYMDVWHLACMFTRDMPDDWVDRLTRRWVMNSKTGFLGKVPLDVRPPTAPENGPFAVSTISTWLVVEGMFRHHRDPEAIACTLGHIDGMNRDLGYPVAPECWDPDYKPWGSMYYNWDGPIVLLLLERLAGVRYSIPDDTFTVCDHLPVGWPYVEARVPVTVKGTTHWVTVRVEREERDGKVKKTVSVRGNPLRLLIIQPWLEERELLSGPAAPNPRGHVSYAFEDARNKTVSITLGAARR